MTRLGIPLFMLLTLLAACAAPNDAPESARPPRGDAPDHGGEPASASAPAANAAPTPATNDAPKDGYLRNPEDGSVLMEVPKEVLVDLRAQLRAAGREDLANEITALYDPATGRVRDAARARAATPGAIATGGAQ